MAATVEITYFTDPYCSWCWATEPMLYRMRETYRDQLRVRYVLGGLVRDMAEFYDASNDISTAAQVAPHWRMVSERTGQPIDERLMEDITNPHFSTWPACTAAKAAQEQGEAVGERFLRRLRRAALAERTLVSDHEVQVRLAGEVAGLDLERWRADLESGRAEAAFQRDLAECRRYGATGFPTLLFRYVGPVALAGDQRGYLVGGHRAYATYQQVLQRVAPGLPEHAPRELLALLAEAGPLTTRELSEVYGLGPAEMRTELDARASEGRVRMREARGGEFWEAVA
ncbi:MAG: DsbA family protein [Chloroflexi bacterium]|nr:DsbA family protein [Chloroflexota bacterium]